MRLVGHASKQYAKTILLRQAVLRSPLGLRFTEEELEQEKDSFHFAIYKDEEVVACVVLQPLGAEKAKLRQMAVAEKWRGHGLGKEMIKFVEDFARAQGVLKIELNAREEAVGFYEKQGYVRLGEKHVEVGLPHWKMSKKMK